MTSGQNIIDLPARDIPWRELGAVLSKRDRHLGFLNVLLTVLFAAAVGLMFVQIPPQQTAMIRLMIAALWLASLVIDTMELATFVKSVRGLLSADVPWRLPSGANARFVKAEARSLRFDLAPGKVSISHSTVREMALKAELSAKIDLGKETA